MKTDVITFADLECLLFRLGFACVATAGPQRLYQHPGEGQAQVVYPPYQEEEFVRPHHLVHTRWTLDNWGLMERDDFDRLMQNGGGAADCPPPTAPGTDATPHEAVSAA